MSSVPNGSPSRAVAGKHCLRPSVMISRRREISLRSAELEMLHFAVCFFPQMEASLRRSDLLQWFREECSGA